MNNNSERPNQEFIQNFINNSANYTQIQQQKQKKPIKKKLIIAGAIILLFVFVFAARATIRSKNGNAVIGDTAILNVRLIPTSASVEINGISYTNGTHRLPSGKCHAIITAEGFIQKELDFELVGNANSYLLQYLLPDTGAYTEEEYDLLRFITRDQTIEKMLSEYMIDKEIDYEFPSERNSIFASATRIAAKGYSDYANRVIRQTVSAFFYYLLPEVRDYQDIKYKADGSFTVLLRNSKTSYSVSFISTYKNGVTGEKEINGVRIKETGQPFTIFEYYGQFTFDYSNLEPIIDKVDRDDERITTQEGISDE